MAEARPTNDSSVGDAERRERKPEEERPRARKAPRRPRLVIGPTTDDTDVQLE